jgi:hypothetical protein
MVYNMDILKKLKIVNAKKEKAKNDKRLSLRA